MFSLCSLTGKTWHLWELVDRTVVCCVWCIGDIFNLQHSKLVERSLCPCYGSFDFTQEVSGGIKKTTSTNAPVILGDDFWAVSLVPSNEPTLKRAVTEICEESGVCFLWSHLRHVRLGLSKCWCFFPATSCPAHSWLPFTYSSTNEASFILISPLYRVGSPSHFLQQSFLCVANCCISYRAPQPGLPVGPASCSCHTSVLQQNNVKCGEGEKEEVQSSSQQRAEYTFQVSDS